MSTIVATGRLQTPPVVAKWLNTSLKTMEMKEIEETPIQGTEPNLEIYLGMGLFLETGQ